MECWLADVFSEYMHEIDIVLGESVHSHRLSLGLSPIPITGDGRGGHIQRFGVETYLI